MADAFSKFFKERPATHIHGSKQIDLISVSRRLPPYVEQAFILSPDNSEGDHSTIGIDFNFGSLTDNANLSGVDPGHVENQGCITFSSRAALILAQAHKRR
jgi:hypothetical protein